MTYSVKEIFYTLQGEGANCGRAAVFCRFSGCNLWSGREEDRKSAVCSFCDTDFIGTDGFGGGRFANATNLAAAVSLMWPEDAAGNSRLVVCTGGEPLLQLDYEAIDALHRHGFEVAIETNGTKIPPKNVDWICVSPKIGAELKLCNGDELKLVYPQIDGDPHQFESLEFDHFFLQPMDGPDSAKNIRSTIDYCLKNPTWRLSLQTHKLLGLR
jgi:7-carboxy-7-deazaguanine synthase (Cx14CxxC type)